MSWSAARMSKRLGIAAGEFHLVVAVQGLEPAKLGLQGDDDVFAHGKVAEDAVELAVLGAEAETGGDGLGGVADGARACRRR